MHDSLSTKGQQAHVTLNENFAACRHVAGTCPASQVCLAHPARGFTITEAKLVTFSDGSIEPTVQDTISYLCHAHEPAGAAGGDLLHAGVRTSVVWPAGLLLSA